jgi:GntR family histidine utilization transcriptional repressor
MPKQTERANGVNVPASIYRRIFTDIEHKIVSGAWPPGHRIPSEKDLSLEYGCSRMTVNKALSQLVREGYVERRRRAGSVVARPHALSAVLEIHDVASEVRALGLAYGYELRTRKVRPIRDADQGHFETGDATRLIDLSAVHFAGSRPFCFEERLINTVAVPGAVDESFADIAPGAWLLSRVPWNAAEHEIRAVAADAAMAAALDIPVGAPCLVIERRTWNADHVVTFVRLSYAGASHSLIARFAPSQADARPGP